MVQSEDQSGNHESIVVSVLLPVFNAELYLPLAIESILNQTLTDFELIIINDGSTDGSLKVIQSYAARDVRIKVISRENKGLIFSLNEGVGLAKGKYIARMDADDFCHPTRLEKQFTFLEQFREIGVLSTNALPMPRSNYRIWPFFNAHHDDIVALLPFHSPLVHASAVFRREVLGQQPYDSDYPHAEDYKLWTDLVTKTRFANLPETLYEYRIHDAGVSKKYNELQVTNTLRIIREYLLSKGVTVWNENLHRGMITSFFQKNDLDLYALMCYIDQLEKAMNDRAFTKKANWIKAIFVVHNTKIPFLFIFHLLFIHFRSIKQLTFRQFLSLVKRSFTR